MNYLDQYNVQVESGLITPTKHPALYDYAFQKSLATAPWNTWLSNGPYFDIYDEYINTIEKWILSSKLNSITGLGNFSYKDVIVGTTQTFDEGYFTHANRRLRVFNNEYGYHKRNFKNVKNLDDSGAYVPLDANDWVIVSLPFSGNGNYAPYFKEMLTDAEEKQVPVIIDCAWFGTCRDIHLELNSKAIESVSFSLSKGIGLGYMRTGIRYSNLQSGPIRQQNDYKHLVFSNMQLALHQMSNFTPDYVQEKYFASYKQVCYNLGLAETNCIHVAKYDDKLVGIRNLVKQKYKEATDA